jgi:2-haloacid dehalogenase
MTIDAGWSLTVHDTLRTLPAGPARACRRRRAAMDIDDVEVLAFDVFGTVVDWYSSVAAEVTALGLAVDGGRFALAWRARYAPTLRRVAAGDIDWAPLDDLHRLTLEECLDEFGVTGVDEERKRHLTRAWHRLRPWPDSVEGLMRLKCRFVVCTLSNGNIGLLTRMAKFAGLPWDCILSAENVGRYKPDPAAYLHVGRVFDVPPSRVLMVAAHHDDLAGARRCGLRTAYVERPREFGPQGKDVSPDPAATLHVRDLRDLAARLGC